jgi:hypothetical protein
MPSFVKTASVVRLVKEKPRSFIEIQAALGVSSWRAIHGALQDARRARLIKFDRSQRKWTST